MHSSPNVSILLGRPIHPSVQAYGTDPCMELVSPDPVKMPVSKDVSEVRLGVLTGEAGRRCREEGAGRRARPPVRADSRLHPCEVSTMLKLWFVIAYMARVKLKLHYPTYGGVASLAKAAGQWRHPSSAM